MKPVTSQPALRPEPHAIPHPLSHMTTLKPWTSYKARLVHGDEGMYVKQRIQKTLPGKQDM